MTVVVLKAPVLIVPANASLGARELDDGAYCIALLIDYDEMMASHNPLATVQLLLIDMADYYYRSPPHLDSYWNWRGYRGPMPHIPPPPGSRVL